MLHYLTLLDYYFAGSLRLPRSGNLLSMSNSLSLPHYGRRGQLAENRIAL